MEEENKKPNYQEKLKQETEKIIEQLTQNGIQIGNIDYLYKLVDIHKDIANEEYWCKKEEEIDMRYRSYRGGDGNESYGNESYGNYGRGSYGRRRRDGMGRYMARGYDAKYRGEEMIDEMAESYGRYSESSTYGHEDESIESLELMLESVEDFLGHLEEKAKSPEEREMIKKAKHRMSKN